MNNLKFLNVILICLMFLLSKVASANTAVSYPNITGVYSGMGEQSNVWYSYLVITTASAKVAVLYTPSSNVNLTAASKDVLNNCQKMAYISMTDPSLTFSFVGGSTWGAGGSYPFIATRHGAMNVYVLDSPNNNPPTCTLTK